MQIKLGSLLYIMRGHRIKANNIAPFSIKIIFMFLST